MSERITLEPVDDVPPDSRVCHYDELGERAKATVPTLTDTDGASVDETTVDGFRDCDLVKYTDYYEVSVH